MNLKLHLFGSSEIPAYYLGIKKFLNSKNIGFEFETKDIQIDYDQSFQVADVIRLCGTSSDAVWSKIKGLPAQTIYLAKVDALIRKDSVMWPRNYLRKSLRELILSRSSNLDTSCESIIIGGGYESRVAISVLAELGFQKISIVSEGGEENDLLLQSSRRNFLGIQFTHFPMDELVLQAGLNSISINTLPLKPGSQLLNDILYFNYLRPGGMVVNFQNGPFDEKGADLLLAEASSIKSPVVSGEDLALGLELFWIDELLQGKGSLFTEAWFSIKN